MSEHRTNSRTALEVMAENWLKVASLDDVPEDGTLLCTLDGHAICLYNVNGTIFATSDTCTHGEASLADGFIVNADEIECPLHQGRFHIPTGKAVHAPCIVDIKTYSVRTEGKSVMINTEEVLAPRNE